MAHATAHRASYWPYPFAHECIILHTCLNIQPVARVYASATVTVANRAQVGWQVRLCDESLLPLYRTPPARQEAWRAGPSRKHGCSSLVLNPVGGWRT